MIVYFSGTGNSAYVAKRLQRELQDEGFDLFSSIRHRKKDALYAKQPWVIVAPTYAWRIPRVVHEWLKEVELTGSRELYFVMTCGGSIGNAGAYLERLCKEKGWSYQGCMQIVMPENYIALYDAPKKQEALTIIHNAEKQIAEAAEYIRTHRRIPKPEISVRDFVNSAWINPLFYPLIVHADKFYATDACISCGKCEQVCPLGNIQRKQGVPDWGKSCTHCMACICSCPKEAIEYGNSSKGKVRYLCSHVVSKEE